MMAILISVANTKLKRKVMPASFTLVVTIAPGPGQEANMPSVVKQYRAKVSSPSSTHSHNNPSAKICHARWAFFS